MKKRLKRHAQVCFPVGVSADYWSNFTLYCDCIMTVMCFLYFHAGLLCHIDDACISNPCRAGSQCDTNPVNGKFNCNCPNGYKGNTCNDDVNECTIGVFLLLLSISLLHHVTLSHNYFLWDSVLSVIFLLSQTLSIFKSLYLWHIEVSLTFL